MFYSYIILLCSYAPCYTQIVGNLDTRKIDYFFKKILGIKIYRL